MILFLTLTKYGDLSLKTLHVRVYICMSFEI